MKYFYATCGALLLACTSLFAQQVPVPTEEEFDKHNMILQEHVVPVEGTGSFYNDCWGWTDPETGREYAIFGSLENVYIVDITDSESNTLPILPLYTYEAIVHIAGSGDNSVPLTVETILAGNLNPDILADVATGAANAPSLWRDFKTYGHYAYGVVDLGTNATSEEGLLVFDLSPLPDGEPFLARQLNSNPNTGDYFELSHNLYVDEPNGKLYAVGIRGDTDIKVYDLTETPEEPQLIRAINFDEFNTIIVNGEQKEIMPGFNGYVHDIFVEDNIAYCSHINSGEWAIWNLNGLEDGVDPKLVAWVNSNTPGEGGQELQHSSWPTADRKAFVFCEETANQPIGFIDIEGIDFDNPVGNEIEITYLFRDPLLKNTVVTHTDGSVEPDTVNVAHNAFIRDNLLYISYYEDGVQVFDLDGIDFSKNHPLASEILERQTPPTRVAYLDTSPETHRTNPASLPYGTRLPTWNNWGVYPFFESNKIIASDTEYGLFVMSIDNDFNSALSVDLANFTAKPELNQVRLDWATESELDHAGFTIERSANGVDGWEIIKEVAAKGNVAYQMLYTEYDESPLQGTNYYRLGMTGLDTKTAFSNVALVEFASSEMTVNVIPTLVNTKNVVNIQIMDAVVNNLDVRVIDMQGKVVLQQQLATANGTNFELKINELPKGNYVLALDGGNVKATERISIVK